MRIILASMMLTSITLLAQQTSVLKLHPEDAAKAKELYEQRQALDKADEALQDKIRTYPELLEIMPGDHCPEPLSPYYQLPREIFANVIPYCYDSNFRFGFIFDRTFQFALPKPRSSTVWPIVDSAVAVQ